MAYICLKFKLKRFILSLNLIKKQNLNIIIKQFCNIQKLVNASKKFKFKKKYFYIFIITIVMKLQSFEETVKEYNKNQLINLKNNLYISQIVFRKLNLLF